MTHKFTTVQNGSKGTDVYVLQSFLRSMMYVGADGKPLDVDGESGKNTVYAINTFKKQNNIYKVNGEQWQADGVFDEKCWCRLGLGSDEPAAVSNASIRKMYDWAVKTCNDPNTGYSQEYRNERKVNGITYFDCSSFVYYALYYGGFAVDPKAWPFTTYNMQPVLLNLGFREYDAAAMIWKPADILWSQEHTEIVYQGADRAGSGYTMGAHGKTNRALADQVSINTFVSTYTKYPKLYRYEG